VSGKFWNICQVPLRNFHWLPFTPLPSGCLLWSFSPVHPSTMESGSTEINTRVRGSPALGISPNLGFVLAPLRERDKYLWMSLLGMALSCFDKIMHMFTVLLVVLMRSCTCLLHRVSTFKCPHGLHLSR
jgi:hypothetical protein